MDQRTDYYNENIPSNKNHGKYSAKIDINNPETLIMDYLYKKQLIRTYETYRGEKQDKPSSNSEGIPLNSFLDVITTIPNKIRRLLAQ